MDALVGVIALFAGLASFGCFIYVLIKLFSIEGVGHGILGIICSLYTFIWGWQHADELNIRNLMIIWSVAIVFGLILNFTFGFGS